VGWRDRIDTVLTALDRGYAVWTGLLVGAAVGFGTGVLADLPAVPLAAGGAVAGGAVLFVADRYDEEG
jgi:ABC-type uncharacterized transport system permease subunit